MQDVLGDLLGAARRACAFVSSSRRLRLLAGHGRRLQVQETVQLGEKRFVAILRVDNEQFLTSGSANGVSLLCSMQPEKAPASPVTWEDASAQAAATMSFNATLRHEERRRGVA